MPNWCDNSVTLRNEDVSKIDALEQSLASEDKKFLEHLRPNPSGEWEYNWSVENWGTKWEVGIIDWERRDNEIWVSFDSAWSPPTTLYQYIVEQGWEVDAVYYEPGMGYGGIFTTEGGDDYYEFDWSCREDIENLPTDLIEFGDLLTKFDEYELEALEENWADAERTDWFPMDVKPEYEGYYEVEIKYSYSKETYINFVKFVDDSWKFWNEEYMAGWRGLSENPEVENITL